MTRVLVAYGSKAEGTAGLAEMVGEALTARGFEVDVVDAATRPDPGGYDAVVVGGALYMGRWHRSARRFVKRHARTLRQVPVCCFSSGPLDDSAAHEELPPVSGVRRLMDRVGATEHVTFGGRLREDASGFPAAAMAAERAGDWRDPEAVRRWVDRIVPILEPPRSS